MTSFLIFVVNVIVLCVEIYTASHTLDRILNSEFIATLKTVVPAVFKWLFNL